MNATKKYNDKDRIDIWLRLYNWLKGESYIVESWPDDDSSKQNIDAFCRNASGKTLALEHTLIEAFAGEKADADPFLKTLGSLENHPALALPGHTITASQAVRAIPRGIKWAEVPVATVSQLTPVLPTLAPGRHTVTINGARWSLDLNINKTVTTPSRPGMFLTARVYPGDPGPALIINAFDKKIPKLAAAAGDKRTLLLEMDAAAGSIEDQFEQLPEDPRILALLASIDEAWGINSVALESEGAIFTNQIYPPVYEHADFCSFNVRTSEFWQVGR